jgi:hypothetical protein
LSFIKREKELKNLKGRMLCLGIYPKLVSQLNEIEIQQKVFMTTDTPKNIFEAVSKTEHDRRKLSSKEEEAVEAQPTATISKMLEHCRELHENIASSLDRIFNSKGITHNQYRHYVSNQQNFSRKDWEIIEEAQKNTDKELEKLSTIAKIQGEEIPSSATKKGEKAEEGKNQPPTRSEPKRKPMSRRQWLQMH